MEQEQKNKPLSNRIKDDKLIIIIQCDIAKVGIHLFIPVTDIY